MTINDSINALVYKNAHVPPVNQTQFNNPFLLLSSTRALNELVSNTTPSSRAKVADIEPKTRFQKDPTGKPINVYTSDYAGYKDATDKPTSAPSTNYKKGPTGKVINTYTKDITTNKTKNLRGRKAPTPAPRPQPKGTTTAPRNNLRGRKAPVKASTKPPTTTSAAPKRLRGKTTPAPRTTTSAPKIKYGKQTIKYGKPIPDGFPGGFGAKQGVKRTMYNV